MAFVFFSMGIVLSLVDLDGGSLVTSWGVLAFVRVMIVILKGIVVVVV